LPASQTDQGCVYIFTRSNEIWTQQQKIFASDGLTGDQFGYSLSLVGDILLVGSPFADLPSKADEGAVYLYTRSNSLWTFQQKLVSSDGTASNGFWICCEYWYQSFPNYVCYWSSQSIPKFFSVLIKEKFTFSLNLLSLQQLKHLFKMSPLLVPIQLH
jgi:hypothetical protein